MTIDELLQDPSIIESGPIKVALLKGPVYSDDPAIWSRLLLHENAIRLFYAQIGLEVKMNRDFGYAYLDHFHADAPAGNFGTIFTKKSLGYAVTLIGVLLRDELLNREVTRLDSGPVVMTETEIVDLVQAFLKETPDQVKERDNWGSAVREFAKLGFIKDLKNNKSEYQMRPIIRARFEIETLKDIRDSLFRHATRTTNS